MATDEGTAVQQIIEACSDAIRASAVAAHPPELLFHFTDLEALLNIASSRCLWASLATTLNDTLEVRHGVNVAVELLDERSRRGASDYVAALLAHVVGPPPGASDLHFEAFPLVVSLCERVDRSGQWFHYGRSGHGVALGVSSSTIATVGYDLTKVDYDLGSQRTRMARLLDAGAGVLAAQTRELPDDERARRVARVAHLVASHIPLLAVQMKHPSFAEEEEWRMVTHYRSLNGARLEQGAQKREVKFRQLEDRVVPYEELDLGAATPHLIREVVLGHASSASVDAIRLLLVESGANARVRRSEVPVR
jgi:hypothetical protein